jgi:hypothetical protein
MTDVHTIEIYERLIVLLQKSGLGWIVDEVESTLAIGRMKVFEIEKPREVRRNRGGTLLGHVHRPWTEEERLAILLDAVEAALCGPALLAEDLIAVSPELRNRVLEFAPDDQIPLGSEGFRERVQELAKRSPVRAAHSVRLGEDVAIGARDARKLSELLSRLREELDADIE